MWKNFFIIVLAILGVADCAAQPASSPKREFRGVWVATVANIDWPSKPALTVEQQKAELIRIFDDHQKSGMNAIIFQVRPAADAFYAKSREMWSRYLTGVQGKAPSPEFDPLEFAITEAHKRGMELHAWFNPYRATMNLIDSHTHPLHITKQKPSWFFTYGGKKLFNPGLPEVREYIISVVMDVVRGYDIDGVHFDDYFYPYPEPNQMIRDHETFYKYGAKFKNIDDWRRHNVDTLIQTLSDSIHAAKKYVKFGISPFAIWRNKSQDPLGSESSGFDGYSKLYADARKWAENGWVDYVNPQLYFAIGYKVAPYDKLLDWWSENSFGRHLYIGQGVYRTLEARPGWSDRRQIPDQIRYLRDNPRVQGSVFFSSKSVTNNMAGVKDSLRNDFYKYRALQPPMLWLDVVDPNPPHELFARDMDKGVLLTWKAGIPAEDGEKPYGYVIYRFEKGVAARIDDPSRIIHITFDAEETSYHDTAVSPGREYVYVVTAIDRMKNESAGSNHAEIMVTR